MGVMDVQANLEDLEIVLQRLFWVFSLQLENHLLLTIDKFDHLLLEMLHLDLLKSKVKLSRIRKTLSFHSTLNLTAKRIRRRVY